MTASKTRMLRRPPVKRDQVVRHLRSLIVAGRLAPGDRLPSYAELKRRFDAQTQTISDVMRVLTADGFIESRNRAGIFVVDRPPHLTNYALVFPWARHQHASQFYRALEQQAEQLTNPQRRINCFYEIQRTDSEDSLRLDALVRAHRLAGVIFAANPFEVEGLPVVEEPGVPRVMIAAPGAPFPMPVVCPDAAGFYARAFDHLAQANWRRVAVISLVGEGGAEYPVTVMQQAAAHGLTIERRWIQGTPAFAPEWARQLAEMLVGPGQTHGPDALLITDDNLVPAATAGVQAVGADVPVLAHTNFPYPTPAAVPVTRLGFEISHLLELCVERIDQQRRGETPAAMTTLPAVFEDEVQQSALTPSAREEGVTVWT